MKTAPLFMASFAAAQTVASINTLCTSSVNSPFCKVYTEVCKSAPAPNVCSDSKALSVLTVMCKTEFASSSECSKVKTACTGNPSSCSADPLFSLIPTSKDASSLIVAVCKEMPSMSQCKVCPNPVNGVSDCDAFGAYMGVCSSMEMSDCKLYQSICAASQAQKIPLASCASFTAPTATGTPTTTPKSSAVAIYPLPLLVLLSMALW